MTDALRHGDASPGEFTGVLAAAAATHGFRGGDGTALRRWLFDLTRDRDSSR